MVGVNLLDPDFSKSFLNLIADLSKLSVSLFIEGEDPLDNTCWGEIAQEDPEVPIPTGFVYITEQNLPEFCTFVRSDSNFDGICSIRMPPGKGRVYRCPAGLWCQSFPFNLPCGRIAFVTVGHRRIAGEVDGENRDDLSKAKLEEFIESYSLSRHYADNLNILFEKVPIVDISGYENSLFDNLYILEDFISEKQKLFDREREISHKYKCVIEDSAHKLSLPMQALTSLASNLSKDNILKDYPRQKDMAERILHETIELSYTISDLKNIMKKEKNQASPVLEEVNIAKCLNDTIGLFRSNARKKGIFIKDPLLKTTNFIVCASKNELNHMLFNLMNNAVKYSFPPKPPNIRYISSAIGGCKEECYVELVNLGPGILPDELKKIGKRGNRGMLGQQHAPDGCGLGLATVKDILESFSGRFEIISEKIGNGDEYSSPYKTTAKISLPFSIYKRKVN